MHLPEQQSGPGRNDTLGTNIADQTSVGPPKPQRSAIEHCSEAPVTTKRGDFAAHAAGLIAGGGLRWVGDGQRHGFGLQGRF